MSQAWTCSAKQAQHPWSRGKTNRSAAPHIEAIARDDVKQDFFRGKDPPSKVSPGISKNQWLMSEASVAPRLKDRTRLERFQAGDGSGALLLDAGRPCTNWGFRLGRVGWSTPQHDMHSILKLEFVIISRWRVKVGGRSSMHQMRNCQ